MLMQRNQANSQFQQRTADEIMQYKRANLRNMTEDNASEGS